MDHDNLEALLDAVGQPDAAAVLRLTGGVPDAWPAKRRKAFAAQWCLKTLGYYHGNLDGLFGPQSTAALEDWRDGSRGLFERPAGRLPRVTRWPTYTSERAMVDFFGPAASHRCLAGRAVLPMPFRLAWDLDEQVDQFKCHELVAGPLTAIYARAFEHYGEARFRELRLDVWGGCFNDRPMRGGTKRSTHAWAVAVDHDPENNQLRWKSKPHVREGARLPAATLSRKEYEPFWEAVESEGAVSLGRSADYDWMHFQFCVPG